MAAEWNQDAIFRPPVCFRWNPEEGIFLRTMLVLSSQIREVTETCSNRSTCIGGGHSVLGYCHELMRRRTKRRIKTKSKSFFWFSWFITSRSVKVFFPPTERLNIYVAISVQTDCEASLREPEMMTTSRLMGEDHILDHKLASLSCS